MRAVADVDRIRRFMQSLGAEADVHARVYFTGGATAILYGWRPTTIDVDVKILPESDRLFRAVLVGRPNAGKSSLYNALIGFAVVILCKIIAGLVGGALGAPSTIAGSPAMALGPLAWT